MIKQHPESAMPEPYKTYVQQRSDTITSVLQDVVGDDNVQLCPRAITRDEQLFKEQGSHIYGAVVHDTAQGYKSVLYTPAFRGIGITAYTMDEAISYAATQFEKGNSVRLKDPRESDGQGQYTVSSTQEIESLFNAITADSLFGCVVMPHLEHINHRISVGRIALGAIGSFSYLGREETTMHEGQQVYGGTSLGLYHSAHMQHEELIAEAFDISPELVRLGKAALATYASLTIKSGRVSVDVIEGITGSGEVLRDVIDITPRVGGTTPAETLAIRATYQDPRSYCYASSRLLYNPTSSPTSGLNFIDTESLVINAHVEEVHR